MKNKPKKNITIRQSDIVVIIIIAILILSSIIAGIRKTKLDRYTKYTIGYPQKIIRTTKRGLVLTYSYFVDNKKYKSSFDNDRKLESFDITKRYFVKFSSNNPDNAIILIDYSVPDTIIEAPVNGWDEFQKLVNK